MKILENFYSVQAEGVSLGVPSYFIRLPGCNLSCQFCDTKEVMKNIKQLLPEDIVEDIKKEGQLENILNGKTHLIFTGGEPTIPSNKKEVITLINYLRRIQPNNKIYSELETNGTNVVEPLFYSSYIQQINCSPKLENSGNNTKQRLNPLALQQINLHNNSWFKFVVDKEEDINEIRNAYLANKSYGQLISPYKVILMPLSDSRDTLAEKTRIVFDLAKKYGVRATTRAHILAWDKKKGV